MRMNFSKIMAASIAVAVMSLTMVSCNGISEKRTSNDSDSVELPKVDTIMLPDTAFASVDDLNYEVEILDSATSGLLDNLINPYDTVPGIFTFRGGH